MEKRKAFTLIELLVVIAMIALLLSILMPALRAAKDQAKQTVCTGHVKGLVLAMMMYVDDYDGKTHDSPNNGLWDNAWQNPAIVREYGPNENYSYWGIAYYPYAKNKKIASANFTLGNEFLNMVHYISGFLQVAFTIDELISRIAMIINYYLKKLLSSQYEVNNPKQYKKL